MVESTSQVWAEMCLKGDGCISLTVSLHMYISLAIRLVLDGNRGKSAGGERERDRERERCGSGRLEWVERVREMLCRCAWVMFAWI